MMVAAAGIENVARTGTSWVATCELAMLAEESREERNQAVIIPALTVLQEVQLTAALNNLSRSLCRERCLSGRGGCSGLGHTRLVRHARLVIAVVGVGS
jgi:hypothetical protein